jgi:hypothetical protein
MMIRAGKADEASAYEQVARFDVQEALRWRDIQRAFTQVHPDLILPYERILAQM